jgi:hypothetical protein
VVQGLLVLQGWELTGEKSCSMACAISMYLKLVESCWWYSMLRANGARMCVDEYGVAYGVRQDNGKFWPPGGFGRVAEALSSDIS